MPTGPSEPPRKPRSLSLGMVAEEPPALDPVCGMQVRPATAAGHHDHAGTRYYFCSELCRRKFRKDPDSYLSEAPRSQQSSSPSLASVRHICPMCPGVEKLGPGACPRCGMALEPAAPQAADAPDPEERDLTRRFRVGAILGVPLLVGAMADMLLPGMPISARIGHQGMYLFQALLAVPIVFWCGWPLLVPFADSLRYRSLNMFTLVGLGISVATLYSLVALVDGLLGWHLFPASVRAHGGFVEPYFEAAAAITVLVLAGQVLEGRARRRTGDAVRALIGLTPGTAHLILPGGAEIEMPLAYIEPGDRVRVRVGERIPVDGVVEEGTSHVDESMLTGEPRAVRKAGNDPVSAGTLNGLGPLVIRTQRVGDETLLGQIVRLVSEARRSRLPVQQIVDRVAAWFVPVVMLTALLTAIGWLLSDSPDRQARAILSAIDVLVIACPCALGLASPMAVVVGSGQAARLGILFQSASVMQRLATISTVVLDKTGTLTEGKPRITVVEAAIGADTNEVLGLAASVERGTEHPLGLAIVAEAVQRGISLRQAEEVRAEPGLGIRGLVDGREVVVGSYGYMIASGVLGDAPASRMSQLRQEGATVILIAVDGRHAGLIALTDPLRPTTANSIDLLRQRGLKVVLLTGDHRATAEAVSRKLMLAEVIAETLPAGKFDTIRNFQARGERVVMVGDGVNDAPALAAADVGIAIGTGTDIAIAVAGVTLVRPDLRGVAAAIDLSQAVMRTIRQNLFLAFVYNIVAMPVAATGLISPMWAAAAMSLSSVSVIANSLRLQRRSLR